MDIPENIIQKGLDQAWELISDLDPAEVCLRSGADYEYQSHQYILICFGQEIRVDLEKQSIKSSTQIGDLLTDHFSEFFNISLLWYLIQAKQTDCTERLVHPSEIPGGDIFAKGAHALPLDKIASRFGQNSTSFNEIGGLIGVDELDFGDAAIKLWPFPKVPIVVVLWVMDEEFPARATLLLDSTAHLHLPPDILWATAMLSLKLLLQLDKNS